VVYEQPLAQAMTYAAAQPVYEQAQSQVVGYGASMGAQPVYEQPQTQAVTYSAPAQVVYEQPQAQAMTYAAPAAQPVYEQQQAVTYALPAQTSVYEQQYQQPAVQYAASTTQPVYEQQQQVMYTGGAPMQAMSFAVPGQMNYATAAPAAPAMTTTHPNTMSFIPPAGQPQVGYQQEHPGMATAGFGGSPAMGMTGGGMMQQTAGAEGVEPAAPLAPMPVQEPAAAHVGAKSKKNKKLVTKKTRKDCC